MLFEESRLKCLYHSTSFRVSDICLLLVLIITNCVTIKQAECCFCLYLICVKSYMFFTCSHSQQNDRHDLSISYRENIQRLYIFRYLIFLFFVFTLLLSFCFSHSILFLPVINGVHAFIFWFVENSNDPSIVKLTEELCNIDWTSKSDV